MYLQIGMKILKSVSLLKVKLRLMYGPLLFLRLFGNGLLPVQLLLNNWELSFVVQMVVKKVLTKISL